MNSKGYLFVQVFTSNARIPVENATITVTQLKPDGKIDLLAIWITDENGRTPILEVEAPDRSLSQTPTDERPFSRVDVTAEHPLYKRVIVNSVQIFPDTYSIQPVRFIPLNEFPETWNETELFLIPPQNL